MVKISLTLLLNDSYTCSTTQLKQVSYYTGCMYATQYW